MASCKEKICGWKYLPVPIQLCLGVASTVMMKYMITTEAIGLDKYPIHSWHKPWFMSLGMFIGELLAIFVYVIGRISGLLKEDRQVPMRKVFFLLAIVAGCDLIASTFGNIALLYLEASVQKMLEGFQVIATAVMQKLCRKRLYYAYMWTGVVIVAVGLVIIGVAVLLAAKANVGSEAGIGIGKVLLAMFLTIGAQVLRATESILNELFIKGKGASPIFCVGSMGIWGVLMCACIFIPAAQHIGGQEGAGIHEDALDAMAMLRKSTLLLSLYIVWIFVILGLNVAGLFTVQASSAVGKTFVESGRVIGTWVVQTVIFYAIADKEHGEEWTLWSIMKLGGFGVLLVGMLIFSGIIRFPWWSYDVPKQEEGTEEPAISHVGDALLDENPLTN